MQRRKYLGTICLPLIGLSGCIGLTGEDEKSQSLPKSESPTVDNLDCPVYEDSDEQVICSNTADSESVSIYLAASKAESGNPNVRLFNNTSSAIVFNPYSWTIHERVGGGWNSVTERSSGNGRKSVEAGETHSWPFSHITDSVARDGEFSSGTYAAGIRVKQTDSDEWIRCVTILSLDTQN
jgi:hypothetical protein